MNRDSFHPAWWLTGAHAQTLGARLLRSRRGATLTRERIELPDGDFLDLDWAELSSADGGPGASPQPPDRSNPVVLVLHGLEGSARSKYALEAYRQLLRRGIAAVGLNFRSCSGEMNRLPRLYHSGDTDDLRFVLRVLRQRFPERALGAVGFSLGGNVLLKYLGESARVGEPEAAVLPSAAVAISVPFDLAAGGAELERGFGKVYRSYLVRRLKRKIRAKAHLLSGRVQLARLRHAVTFYQFDDVSTAPLHGFRDADDYYARASSGPFLPSIRVPTLLIHSADDPFFPASALPHAALRTNQHLEVALTSRGGHVGFVTGAPWAPVFWAERTAATWIERRLSGMT